MSRPQSTPATKARTGWAAFFLLLCPLLIFVALIFGDLFLIRDVLKPPDGIVSGPLSVNKLGVIPSAVLMVYVFVIATRAVKKARTTGADLPAILKGDLLRFKTLALTVVAFAVYLAGLSAYWVATPEGVVEHRALLMGAINHPWRDLTRRSIGCGIGKGHRKFISFGIEFSDGFKIDLADTQQNDAQKQFPQLSELTKSARSVFLVRNYTTCPSEVARVVANW